MSRLTFVVHDGITEQAKCHHCDCAFDKNYLVYYYVNQTEQFFHHKCVLLKLMEMPGPQSTDFEARLKAKDEIGSSEYHLGYWKHAHEYMGVPMKSSADNDDERGLPNLSWMDTRK